MEKRIMTIFTRTPLHVGAGNSVGAIDSPIMRERHTGYPVIPATAIKGVLADEWTEIKEFDEKGRKELKGIRNQEGVWLFGSQNDKNASSGSLLFGEARILAFPIRSAKGSYAWITCPTILRRAIRDGAVDSCEIADVKDDSAFFAKNGTVSLGDKIVLEEYTFSHAGELPSSISKSLSALTNDSVWKNIANRLVIVSDGMMTHFCVSACEVAQHVAINDITGTAKPGALFNQENVPSETIFYSAVHFTDEKGINSTNKRQMSDAIKALSEKLVNCGNVLQIGGDGSTGLGYCTVELLTKEKGA